MSIDLRNHVQVNINYKEYKPLSTTRDTIVYLYTEATSADKIKMAGTYSSLQEYIDAYHENVGSEIQPESMDNYTFVKSYFDNGGGKIKILTSSQTLNAQIEDFQNQIVDLEPELIVITAQNQTKFKSILTYDGGDSGVDLLHRTKTILDPYKGSLNSELGFTPNISTSGIPALSGINEKLFIFEDDKTSYIDTDAAIFKALYGADNIAIKISNTSVTGISALTAAYLSKININKAETINDYNFTIENISAFNKDNLLVSVNEDYTKVIQYGGNCNTIFVNEIRNMGGDTVTSIDLVNTYMRIILTQTLSEKVASVLAAKIKYDKTGINRVINAITQELNRYKDNGYLDVNYIYNDEDLHYKYNGVDYLVCSRNTVLENGYKFIILPLTSLTKEQIKAHAFPPIYVMLATSVGIRYVLINGDIY